MKCWMASVVFLGKSREYNGTERTYSLHWNNINKLVLITECFTHQNEI